MEKNFSGNKEDAVNYVNAILESMTLEELAFYADVSNSKAGLTTESGYTLPGGVAGADAIAGIDTDFPMPISMGQTWNKELAKNVGEIIGTESRGQYALEEPNVLIFSAVGDIRVNPLSGRYYEGFGEDPHHVEEYVKAVGNGAKGDHPFYVKALPDTKHHNVYISEWDRKTASNFTNVRSLRDYYYGPFIHGIESGIITGTMSAFGGTNGVPNQTSPLLKDLQDAAEYPLLNLGDYQGDNDQVDGLGNGYDETYVKTADQLAALVLLSGNFTSNTTSIATSQNYLNAVEKGLFGVDRSTLENFLRPQFIAWARNGYFNRDEYPYTDLASDGTPLTSASENSQKVALQAARECIVLLKNENSVLPLKDKENILVSGYYAENRVQPNFATATPDLENAGLTPLEGITLVNEEKTGTVKYVREAIGDSIRFKSNVTGNYIVFHEDGTLTADEENAENASVFVKLDEGQRAYSFINLESDQFLGVDRERLTGLNFGYYMENSWDVTAVVMEENEKNLTPRVWTYEEQDGHKVLRYGAIVAEVWQQLVTGIPFYQSYIKDGIYLSVDADTSQVTVGNTTLEGPDERAYFEVEVLKEAGTEISLYSDDYDKAIIFVGKDPFVSSGEFTDRMDLELGENQLRLIEKTGEAFPGNTIVVVKSEYPLNIETIKNNDNIAAIVVMSYAGEYDALALAQILYGEVTPSAKLAGTWLQNIDSLPMLPESDDIDPAYKINMKAGDLISEKLTYMYREKSDVTYPLGYGLSYTEFEYSGIEILYSEELEMVTAKITIKNAGDMEGKEVIQVYAGIEKSAYHHSVPKRQLVSFEKTSLLAPGESETLMIEVPVETLKKWNVVNSSYFIESGSYQFCVAKTAEEDLVSVKIDITGEELPVLELSGETYNVWDICFDSSSIVAAEVSKKRTAEYAGGYFAVESKAAGDYVVIPKVNLSNITALTFSVSSQNEASEIEVYSGSLIGEPLCSLRFTTTGSDTFFLDEEETIEVTEAAYTSVRAAVSSTAETEDLYIKFNNPEIRISTIQGE